MMPKYNVVIKHIYEEEIVADNYEDLEGKIEFRASIDQLNFTDREFEIKTKEEE